MCQLIVSSIGTALLLVGAVQAELSPRLLAGESLTYQMTHLLLVAGTTVLEAGGSTAEGMVRLTPSASSSPLVSRLQPVDDRLESRLEPGSASVVLSCKHAHEGRRAQHEAICYDLGRGRAPRTTDFDPGECFPIPIPILDSPSSLYVLRTLPLVPGRAFLRDVQSGGRVYPLVVVVEKRERLRTRLGDVEPFVVEPRFRDGLLLRKEGRLTLWVTTDQRRTPLRITSESHFGSLTATRSAYDRPLGTPGVVESACRQPGN